MFKLPLRKLLFIVKLSFLFLLVLITLSLFEYWRGGRRATRAYVLDPDEELYEKQILEDEARIIPGLGEGGRPAYLTGEDKRLGEEAEKKYAVNTYLSDRIAYNRTLKDFRNPACERVTYDAELPSTSVIIIFHNEPYSVVVRTIWSVLNTARRDQPWHRQANYLERGTGRIMKLGYPGQPEDSEHVYLKEIILVDDNSTLPELRGKLARYVRTRLPPDMVRILRLPDRIGLTRARLAGARFANGEVLIFLDAHCEGVTDWMRPLLQRIKDSPTAVVMPIIDVVEHKDFFYSVQDPSVFQVGGFTFVGHFTWIDVPEREKRRRGSDIAPTWSPTMAGGLFAIRRAYYWELGAYDEQMAGWGGENLEMSFRIWQCGGTLETIPCSRVGHVFRSFHPYGLPANSDTHGINTARMAEVWMDDYAELFYLHRPDLRKNPIIGDVTHRKVLREKLHCKSFQWFLDNVYREKYVPVRDSTAFGRVQNTATHLCLDTMQREGEGSPLGLYPCHSKLTDTQHLSLSLAGQLRDEERCADVQFARMRFRRIKKFLRLIVSFFTSHSQDDADEDREARLVVMVTCRESTAKMQWRYIASTGQLQHAGSGLCLDARRGRAGADARARRCEPDDTPQQRWTFDYMGDESNSGVLPAELEQVLGRIRGQRRKSRSLLSVNEEEGAPPESGAAPPGGAGAGAGARDGAGARRHRERRRRRNKKKKKVHKNKFIVTIERTVRNSSVEHLEMDIHCRHRRLYPNNSFVRDLVSILNDRDIRVINNGRVFEKNRVTDLDKERSLRQLEDKVQTTEPPAKEADDESTETATAPTPLTSQPTEAPERDEEVVPPRPTTEPPKPKKRHHKKKHSSKYEKKPRSHEHSLLLTEREDSYHVAIGSGANGTGAQLPAAGEAVPRARGEARDEKGRGEARDERGGRSGEHRHRPRDMELYMATQPPDSSELRLSEDRARGDARDRRNRVDRIRDYGDEVDREDGRDARGDSRRPAPGAPGGEGDEDRYLAARARARAGAGSRAGAQAWAGARGGARAAALARHAEMYGHNTRADRAQERRGGRPPAQILSEAPTRLGPGRDAADTNPWPSAEAPARHTKAGGRHMMDISERRAPSSDSLSDAHPSKDRVLHQASKMIKNKKWPEDDSWDPWAPRAGGGDAGAGGDGRKAAAAPESRDAVERLVYSDVWDRDVTETAPRRDERVSALAREVMMEYEDVTAPVATPRAVSGEAGGAGGGGGGGAGRGRALRVRLKSNMTFNLGDELLNWRRMQMTGQDSESGSPSEETDTMFDTIL